MSSSAMSTFDLSSSSSTAGTVAIDKMILFFHYYPSQAAAIITCVIHILIAIPLAILAYRTRLRLSWILVGTAIALAVGYGIRASVTKEVTLGSFIITELIILLAPNALALLNYKVLGTVIDIMSPADSIDLPRPMCRLPLLMDTRGLIYGRRIATIFFASDIIGFFIQGGGGGQQASSDVDTQKLGSHIVMAGIIFQVIFFALFAFLAVYVYFSPLYNRPPSSHQQSAEPRTTIDKSLLNRVFFALFTTIVLILIRNIYRLIAFAAPYGSYVPSHEWMFYVFDMLVIFSALIVYAVWHFGLYLPNQRTVVSPKNGQQNKHTIQVAGADLV